MRLKVGKSTDRCFRRLDGEPASERPEADSPALGNPFNHPEDDRRLALTLGQPGHLEQFRESEKGEQALKTLPTAGMDEPSQVQGDEEFHQALMPTAGIKRSRAAQASFAQDVNLTNHIVSTSLAAIHSCNKKKNTFTRFPSGLGLMKGVLETLNNFGERAQPLLDQKRRGRYFSIRPTQATGLYEYTLSLRGFGVGRTMLWVVDGKSQNLSPTKLKGLLSTLLNRMAWAHSVLWESLKGHQGEFEDRQALFNWVLVEIFEPEIGDPLLGYRKEPLQRLLLGPPQHLILAQLASDRSQKTAHNSAIALLQTWIQSKHPAIWSKAGWGSPKEFQNFVEQQLDASLKCYRAGGYNVK